MALVMVALMFLTKERLAHRNTDSLLSCNDLVQILKHKLPSKIENDEDLVMTIQNRHRRRRDAMKFAYQKQAATLAASSCYEIRQSRTKRVCVIVFCYPSAFPSASEPYLRSSLYGVFGRAVS